VGLEQAALYYMTVLGALLAAAGGVAYIWQQVLTNTKIRAVRQFALGPLPPIPVYNLFDLGVVDLDQDRRLDLFTANHDFGQSYLVSRDDGSYRDVQTSWRLDQDNDFPGMEDELSDHSVSSPGLYIFFRRRGLVIRQTQPAGAAPADGTVRIIGDIAIRSAVHATVMLKRAALMDSRIAVNEAKFHIAGNGSIDLFVEVIGTPIRFELDAVIPLEMVHVGRGNRHPASHSFTVFRRDRHGHAWADINGDGELDVYIGRGGFRGELDVVRHLAGPDFDLEIEDEMLMNDGSRFHDCADQLGFNKRDCRTRGAAWVDVTNSGRLSLYVTCLATRNQLYVRDASETFVDVAAQAGLDISGSFAFVWVDLDQNGWMDLVIDERDAISVYYNEGGLKFRKVTVAQKPQRFEAKLSVADFDNSGYPSIVAATPDGLMLLINKGGVLHLDDHRARGLPPDGFSAHWVDYDNDGLMDLFVVPHGLYRQSEDGRFHLVPDIQIIRPSQTVQSLVQWYDADNSGFRDAIVAVRRPLLGRVRGLIDGWQWVRSHWVTPDALPQLGDDAGSEGDGYEYYLPTIHGRWSAALLKNLGNANNWLEVILHGNRGNPQAIGATVMLETGTRRQTQGVGWADGAMYSQGHYRLYFGVGKAATIDRLRVRWPLGAIQELANVAVNRILELNEV